MLPATHSLHFRVHTRVFITLFVALVAVAALWAEPAYREALREAGAAQKAGDLPRLIANLDTVLAARPDYPRALLALARAQVAAGRENPAQLDLAFATLDSAAARGLAFDLAKDAAFASIRTDARFAPLAARFAANAAAVGAPATYALLPAQTGLLESAVVDSRGQWYFGDVRQRCIWTRRADGALARFTAPDAELLGVFGLALDETRGVLWAGVSAVSVMQRFDAATEQGRAYFAEFDLATGALRRRFDLPAAASGHVLGSLRLARDGSLFATDSTSPVIWRLAPDATAPEAWLEHGDFLSLQGLAFSADGGTLYVADYANGVWSIDVASKRPTLLRPASDTALFGIDDLHFHAGALIAVQNGIAPVRVVRLTLGDAEVRASVLARGHDSLADAATGTLTGGRFVFVGNSGWALFEGAKTEPAARDVQLLSLAL